MISDSPRGTTTRDRRRSVCARADGGIAVNFALLLFVLLGVVGGGVDFARYYDIRSKIQTAADGAALNGAVTARDSASGGSTAADRTTAQTVAEAWFTKAVAGVESIATITSSAAVTQSSSALTSTVSYTGSISTTLLRILGIDTIDFSGEAVAQVGLGSPTYVDILFVIDASHSMAIGATATDQATMMSKIGCTIGCHFTTGTNTVSKARKAGATLRIDVVKSAISQILTKAQTMQAASIAAGYGSTVRIGLYTLSNTLTKSLAATSDLTAVSTALAAVDIDSSMGQTGTNFHTSLTTLASTSMTIGDGKTAANPKVFVVLMTDGIEDSAYQGVVKSGLNLIADPKFVTYSPYFRDTDFGFNWDIQGFDPSLCAPIKTRGINMMTLNVEYLIPTLSPDSADSRYLYIKNTLKPKIQTNMATCASSSEWALYASTSTDIVTAVDTLFKAATKSSIYLSK